MTEKLAVQWIISIVFWGTQHGKGVAVLIDVGEYELMQEKIEVLQDIQTAMAQVETG